MSLVGNKENLRSLENTKTQHAFFEQKELNNKKNGLQTEKRSVPKQSVSESSLQSAHSSSKNAFVTQQAARMGSTMRPEFENLWMDLNIVRNGVAKHKLNSTAIALTGLISEPLMKSKNQRTGGTDLIKTNTPRPPVAPPFTIKPAKPAVTSTLPLGIRKEKVSLVHFDSLPAQPPPPAIPVSSTTVRVHSLSLPPVVTFAQSNVPSIVAAVPNPAFIASLQPNDRDLIIPSQQQQEDVHVSVTIVPQDVSIRQPTETQNNFGEDWYTPDQMDLLTEFAKVDGSATRKINRISMKLSSSNLRTAVNM